MIGKWQYEDWQGSALFKADIYTYLTQVAAKLSDLGKTYLIQQTVLSCINKKNNIFIIPPFNHTIGDW